MATTLTKASLFRDKVKVFLSWKTVHPISNCTVYNFISYTSKTSSNDDVRVRKKSNIYFLHSQQSTSTTASAGLFTRNFRNMVSSSSTSTPSASTSGTPTKASDRIGHIMQMYEDLVGLTEVKTAQDNVVDAERNFLKVQEDRRTLQQEISEIQAEVRSVTTELEKTHRTDPCYIDLVKKEHGILVKEKEMTTKLKTLDRCERDLFSHLSMYVRESHEKERARAERTKYWSVIGSIVGAVIGITGSTINNHRRLKELRSIVKESGENSAEYKAIADKVIASLSSYPVLYNVSDDNNNNNNNNGHYGPSIDTLQSDVFQQWTETFHNHLNLRTSEILSGLVDIRKLFAVTQSTEGYENVVYVGPEIKSMLQETESRAERNANKNLVISISVMGGIFTVGLSVLAFIFKGS